MKRETIKGLNAQIIIEQRRCAAAEEEVKRLVSLRQMDAEDHESVRSEASRLRLELSRMTRQWEKAVERIESLHSIVSDQAKALAKLSA